MSQYEQIEILLVEDNPEDAEMTMRALRKRNLANQLHWVKDGAEALDYLFGTGQYAGRDKDQPPKLVLLDIKMPKVDGIEVLRRIKASDLRTVPVVVMTSSNEERDVLGEQDPDGRGRVRRAHQPCGTRLVSTQYRPIFATVSRKASNCTGLTM